MILLETLNDPSSKISEFFVLRTKDNKIVTYTGYLDDNGSITTYNIYTSRGTGHFMDYTGKMFLTLGPEVKDKNGKDMTIKVCTVQGVDKYTTQTVVEVDEFRRIEKAILGPASRPAGLFLHQVSKVSKHPKKSRLSSQSPQRPLNVIG